MRVKRTNKMVLRKTIDTLDDMVQNAKSYIENIKSGKTNVERKLKPEALRKEAEEFKTLWEEFELAKMDVREKSEWFLISSEWISKWKDFVEYYNEDGGVDSAMETAHPGMITNKDIIEDVSNVLYDPKRPHLNVNLKENLREEDHYFIVNYSVWKFLAIRYGGVEIKRFGRKRDDDSDE
mmetsp:Transcript_42148/g.48910  ORF Transcript_42148/g.48910 Transcript_42148/m.48910 type:complete len:180 (+) Transcript_42148:292-831(+)